MSTLNKLQEASGKVVEIMKSGVSMSGKIIVVNETTFEFLEDNMYEGYGRGQQIHTIDIADISNVRVLANQSLPITVSYEVSRRIVHSGASAR